MNQSSSPDTTEFLRLLLDAQPQIYAYIRAQVPHRPDAEDVLQDTVATLWESFDKFVPGSNFLAWAYATARYKVFHFRRHKSDLSGFSESFIELVADQAEEMSGEIVAMQDALAECLQKLRTSDREVVEKCYGTDSTIASVANDLGKPVDTVKSILRRSRHGLYDCIQRTMSREDRT